MKRLVAVAFAVGAAVAMPDVRAAYCPEYEFAELSLMTLDELKAVRAEIAKKQLDAFLKDISLTAADRSGCETQEGRLDRLIKAKEEGRIPDPKATDAAGR